MRTRTCVFLSRLGCHDDGSFHKFQMADGGGKSRCSDCLERKNEHYFLIVGQRAALASCNLLALCLRFVAFFVCSVPMSLTIIWYSPFAYFVKNLD